MIVFTCFNCIWSYFCCQNDVAFLVEVLSWFARAQTDSWEIYSKNQNGHDPRTVTIIYTRRYVTVFMLDLIPWFKQCDKSQKATLFAQNKGYTINKTK